MKPSDTSDGEPRPKQRNDRLSAFPLQVPAVLGGAVVSSIPFYGYLVRAPGDDQWIFLVILGAWLVTWVVAVGSIAMTVFMPPKSLIAKCCMIVLILYIWIAGVIGWGGVRHAFWELVAG